MSQFLMIRVCLNLADLSPFHASFGEKMVKSFQTMDRIGCGRRNQSSLIFHAAMRLKACMMGL